MTDITAKLAEPPMTDDQIRQWIDACNHEPAREVLRGVLASRASQSTPDEETVERVARALEAVQDEYTADCSVYIAMDYSRLARAALSAIPADDGWMPIETAPKDGTHFLAYEEAGDIYRAAYHRDGYIVAYCGQYVTVPPVPTHWRPLPAPPAPAQEPRS